MFDIAAAAAAAAACCACAFACPGAPGCWCANPAYGGGIGGRGIPAFGSKFAEGGALVYSDPRDPLESRVPPETGGGGACGYRYCAFMS
jgi:hypothetical protein|tara:strand:+ start:880 stop:1146 length:267 start_codon:yes stop_codon:yes gene_type:complete